MSRKYLLMIDPQNDFCDLPPEACPYLPDSSRATPALPVPGAHDDMLRLASFIERHSDSLANIFITLDSHHRFDIAHPVFWQDGEGKVVAPFTPIRFADVEGGRFQPRDAANRAHVLAYLRALEEAGRYTHMVWPEHCLIGSWGHNIHPALQQVCGIWEERRQRPVDVVFKGMNAWTEHYSAVMAEVPDAGDPATSLNRGLIERLAKADAVYIAGEAGSHCVRSTVEHIVAYIGEPHVGKLVLLTDCMSPVSGFSAEYELFLAAMREKGVRLRTSGDSM